MNALPALSVTGLTKSFRRKLAVDNVSLSVARGEIVGFLGPNGAGKTTVMNMVMGLVAPDAGRIDLLGEPDGYRRADVRMRIGFLQEKPRIYPDMTARAYLDFFAGLYGIPTPDARVTDVLNRVNLTAAADRKLGTFSRGMQQRACLARVMLHRPELLILDEPTLGLDPNGVAEMRAIFREMKAEGVTLLFSSHQLAEMERVCDSVIFMRAGRVIAAGRQADLLPALPEGDALSVELYEPVQPLVAGLSVMPGLASVRERGSHMLDVVLAPEVATDARGNRAWISRALSARGLTVLGVGAVAPSLEDLFLGLTGDQDRTNTPRH
jgi:ABC-2 type transport system ATP-binding protein